jgi:glycosyltransferase involved in cell wall biosynthesis
METKPLFSIITVVFNGAAHLEETLLSVVRQSFADREYLIIDGGSKDGTVDIIRKHEERLTFWSSEPDKGIYDAMNKGIRRAAGKFLIFMNAGDHFVDNDVLRDIAPTLNAEKDMIVCGDAMVSYGLAGSRLLRARISLYDMPTFHQAMFFNREVFTQCGFFNTAYRYGADFDLWQKVFLNSRSGLRAVSRVVSVNNLEGLSNRHWGQIWWERVVMCRRNLPFPQFCLCLFVRLGEGARLVLISMLKKLRVYDLVLRLRISVFQR